MSHIKFDFEKAASANKLLEEVRDELLALSSQDAAFLETLSASWSDEGGKRYVKKLQAWREEMTETEKKTGAALTLLNTAILRARRAEEEAKAIADTRTY